jgi:hypothetical protein
VPSSTPPSAEADGVLEKSALLPAQAAAVLIVTDIAPGSDHRNAALQAPKFLDFLKNRPSRTAFGSGGDRNPYGLLDRLMTKSIAFDRKRSEVKIFAFQIRSSDGPRRHRGSPAGG